MVSKIFMRAKSIFLTIVLVLGMISYALVLCPERANAATTLSAGDIAVLGINGDDSFPNQRWAFVPLVDISSGTVIHFTDAGYFSDTNQFYDNSANEGHMTWTVPSYISAGTTFIVTNNSGAATIADINSNSYSGVSGSVGGSSYGFTSIGDQIIVYQGTSGQTAGATFIYAFNSGQSPANYPSNGMWLNSDNANKGMALSHLPSGLSNGTTAIALTSPSSSGSTAGGTFGFDNMKYNGSTSGTKAEILAAIGNPSNWVGDNTNAYDFSQIGNFNIIGPNTAPTVSNVSISGTVQVGQTLTGSYDYSDVNGDLEGTSTFKWYRSDDTSGTNKTEIAGAASTSYTLVEADLGKYISFEVTPVAQTGTSPGSAEKSGKTGAVTAPALSLADNPTLIFTGTDESNLGQILHDGSSGSTDISDFDLDIFPVNYSAPVSNTGSWVFFTDANALVEGDQSLITAIDATRGNVTLVQPPDLYIIKSSNGSEFNFKSIWMLDFSADGANAILEGFRDGSSTGAVSLNINNITAMETVTSVNGLTPSIFQNVDEVRISYEYSGSTDIGNYLYFNNIQIGIPVETQAAPTVTTDAPATNITSSGATVSGEVTSDGNATITERGIVYSTSANPTTSDAKVTAAGMTGTFSVNLNGLNANTTYHYRAYATNSQGASYGSDEIFTTSPIYTVTYDGNGKTGGSVPTDSNTYEQGATVIVLGNTGSLGKTGYTFAGWNTATDGSGTDYATDATFTMGTYNVTLYAKWTAVLTYTIASIDDQALTALTYGYTSGSQESKTITVTRSGTGDLANLSVALSGANADDFEITQPLATTLNDTTTFTTFTVKAKDGRAAGTYTATVTVSADNMTNVSFTVTQVVRKATPSVSEWPTAFAIPYGEALSASTLSGGVAGVAGTFAFTNGAITPSAGTYGASVTFTPTDTANYNIVAGTVNMTVQQKQLTIGGSFTVHNKTYDGTSTALISINSLSLSGIVGGDTVSLTGVTIAIANAGAGTGKTVNITGASLDGPDAGNYTLSLDNAPTATADISAKELTITGATAENKVYNGTTAAVISGAQLSGVVAGDEGSVSLADHTSGTFADKNVGTGISVTTAMTLTGARAGNYTLTQPVGLTANITAKELTIGGSFTANNKTYDGTTGAAIADKNLTLNGVVGSEEVSLTGVTIAFADANTGTAKIVSITGGSLSGADNDNYTLVLDNAPTTTADISAKELTIIGATAENKVYDGTTDAIIPGAELVGVISSDDVALDDLAGTFTDANAGENKEVTAALTLKGAAKNYYTLTQPVGLTANITPKELTVTGATAENKVYDGSTVAVITGAQLSGEVTGDEDGFSLADHTAGTFADKNVGTGISLTTAMTLTGAKAGNYTLTQPTGLTADITAKELTIGGSFTAENKVYDNTTGTTIANNNLTLIGVETGDIVSLTGVPVAFADAGAGTGKTVRITDASLTGTDGGNYTLSLTGAPTATADITAKELTITGATAENKVYNGTTAAVISGAQLSGVVPGDEGSVSLADHTSGTFAEKNVGTGISVTTAMTLTGAQEVNYTLTQPAGLTAGITAKELTIGGSFTAGDKLYDGTTTAVIETNNLTLNGVVGSEEVSLTGVTIAFADANTGTAKIVSITGGSLSGADNDNYTLVLDNATTTTADITAKELTIIGATAENKVYDGTTVAVISGVQLSGVVAGDEGSVSLADHTSGTFAEKNVGTGISVTTAMTLTGAQEANYTLTQPAGLTAGITAKELTIGGSFTAGDKLYDGTTTAVIETNNLTLTGLVDGDVVSLTGVTVEFANANAGSGKTVTITGASLTGAAADNYILSLTGAPTATAAVIPALSGLTMRNAANEANIALSPGFATGTKNYTANVTNTVTQVSISPTVADSTVTVKISKTGTEKTNVNSGAWSEAIPLNVGDNVIQVEVASQDGFSTQTYTITVTRQSQSDSGGETPSQLQPKVEEITVPVETKNPGSGSTVAETKIKRTTGTDGQVRDEVTFDPELAKEAVNKIKEAGQNTARLVIPDPKDEVAQVEVTIPRDTTRELAGEKVHLEISTANARIIILEESMQQLNENLYFRVVPVKEEMRRKEVEERARVEQIVREVAQDRSIQVVGRPNTIETNMQNRQVDIIMPLPGVTLPQNAVERAAFLADLVVFIEHSDGDRVLKKVTVVPYTGDQSQLGVKFSVGKFSTFTILHMEGWEEYLAAQEAGHAGGYHEAYIKGFPDGTFGPERNITRAEMAAILARVAGPAPQTAGRAYPDVGPDHWAQEVIAKTSRLELMGGYPDGTFGPERNIARAEMAVIVTNWPGLTEVRQAALADIKGHWAEEQIGKAVRAGIMTGYPDGSFRTDAPTTRAEAVTVINKLLGRGPLQGVITATWPDVPTGHWAFGQVEEASHEHYYLKTADGRETLQ